MLLAWEIVFDGMRNKIQKRWLHLSNCKIIMNLVSKLHYYFINLKYRSIMWSHKITEKNWKFDSWIGRKWIMKFTSELSVLLATDVLLKKCTNYINICPIFCQTCRYSVYVNYLVWSNLSLNWYSLWSQKRYFCLILRISQANCITVSRLATCCDWTNKRFPWSLSSSFGLSGWRFWWKR